MSDENDGMPYTKVPLVGVNLERLQRKVWCQHCNYQTETNLPGALCGKCHAPLITVHKSDFDAVTMPKSIINNELA